MAGVAGYLGHSYRESSVDCWRDGKFSRLQDYVAEEAPVSLVYNGVPHVVMLATPLDLEDFALGFSLTEGILGDANELHSVRVVNRSEGIEVLMRIPDERCVGLSDKRRNLTGRTGCGLCGATTLRQAVRHPTPVAGGVTVTTGELHQALEELRTLQTLNRITGAVHAATWVVPGKGIAKIREDVGRHNALDKLIGVLARMRTDRNEGFVLVTSRASYEMVQKCAAAGVSFMAAISAPTALAVRLAHEARLTLVGFARDDGHVVYAHPQRLIHPD